MHVKVCADHAVNQTVQRNSPVGALVLCQYWTHSCSPICTKVGDRGRAVPIVCMSTSMQHQNRSTLAAARVRSGQAHGFIRLGCQ